MVTTYENVIMPNGHKHLLAYPCSPRLTQANVQHSLGSTYILKHHMEEEQLLNAWQTILKPLLVAHTHAHTPTT